MKRFSFSAVKSVINQKKYQIEMIETSYRQYPPQGWYKEYYSTDEDICKKLNANVTDYRNDAVNNYSASITLEKYLLRPLILFDTKKDAKKFIKEYIQARLVVFYILRQGSG